MLTLAKNSSRQMQWWFLLVSLGKYLQKATGAISATSQIPRPRNIWPRWLIFHYSTSVNTLCKEFKKPYGMGDVSEHLNYNFLRDWPSTVWFSLYIIQQTEHEWYKALPRQLSTMTIQELMTFSVWFRIHESVMALQSMVVIGTYSSFYAE